MEVKYFTSRVRKPPGSRVRQGRYLDALAAHGGVTIIEGFFEHRPTRCEACEHKWDRPKEKMTDVNIATALLMDALDDRYDAACSWPRMPTLCQRYRSLASGSSVRWWWYHPEAGVPTSYAPPPTQRFTFGGRGSIVPSCPTKCKVQLGPTNDRLSGVGAPPAMTRASASTHQQRRCWRG